MKTSIINFGFLNYQVLVFFPSGLLIFGLLFKILLCRVFVGTVSEFCAKHAECPVITIKRSVAESPEDPIDD